MKNSRLFLKKAYLKITSKLINLVASETNQDIENTILIIGSTRSGTTYLMENINSKNDYRLIFEPFNNAYTSEWKDFPARHYIDPDLPTELEEDVVHEILTGQVSNPWIDQYNRKVRSDRRLIKAVRANLIVEYIRDKYPDLPIIYLIRDPYEVVASRINMIFDPKDLSRILKQTLFLKRHYSDINFDILYEKTESNEAKHTALWCIENRYLLRKSQDLNLIYLEYKDIKGMSVKFKNGQIMSIKQQSNPSASSAPRKKYILSQSEKENIKIILDLFGMSI